MLGQRDVVQRHVSNFWIDYLEIPGKSLADAQVRYTFRMQEQDNIWESYQIILQRLRNFVDAPHYPRVPRPYRVAESGQVHVPAVGTAHADTLHSAQP